MLQRFSPTIFYFQRSDHTKRTLIASGFNEKFGTLSYDRDPFGSQEFVEDDLRFCGRIHKHQVVYFVHSGTPTITDAGKDESHLTP
ncbi:unnamed protein product [Echinostoma caproni]|uniref:Uncharacterized protein n=1 Tax=Echinostoma caproni TaxID=27848 RepID=A0A183BBB8_9TREM|nr:unnamed protein product [Echinostoma caproni]